MCPGSPGRETPFLLSAQASTPRPPVPLGPGDRGRVPAHLRTGFCVCKGGVGESRGGGSSTGGCSHSSRPSASAWRRQLPRSQGGTTQCLLRRPEAWFGLGMGEEAEPSLVLPIQLSPCLRPCPLHPWACGCHRVPLAAGLLVPGDSLALDPSSNYLGLRVEERWLQLSLEKRGCQSSFVCCSSAEGREDREQERAGPETSRGK